MKKNFTQPFEESSKTTALLLIEVKRDNFLQFTMEDELGAFYADTLTTELDRRKNTALQLVEKLHNNSLELTSYRELTRETLVSFSYADDTPGKTKDVVCIHVSAEYTGQPIPQRPEQTVEFVTLKQYIANLRATGMPISLLEESVSQLSSERSEF